MVYQEIKKHTIQIMIILYDHCVKPLRFWHLSPRQLVLLKLIHKSPLEVNRSYNSNNKSLKDRSWLSRKSADGKKICIRGLKD